MQRDRTVSFLELFYDLVYVVLIARAAHHLADHVSWQGLGEFAIVFGMIWIAWLNGTLYHELHGRDDGRGRSFIFIQMLLLAILAVYASHATDTDGAPFALTYAAFLAVLTWQWHTVRRHDPPQYRPMTGRYLAGMIAATVLVGVSAVVPAPIRLILWAGLIAGSVVGGVSLLLGTETGRLGVTVAESLAERYGLFTIIVLCEVVVGVVSGLSETGRDAGTLVVGGIGLCVGFGIWWNYFDLMGRRTPRHQHSAIAVWAYGHLPLTMAVAAAGAAMVSLVEHGHDGPAPVATAWLLSGAVAAVLLLIAIMLRSLAAASAAPERYRPMSIALAIGALPAIAVGWARPAPWALTLALLLILGGTWLFAFTRGFPQHTTPS